MRNIKYVGIADVRELDAAAFKSVGVDDQNKVVWDTRKPGGNVQEVSDAAAEYLLSDTERGQFIEDGDDEPDQPVDVLDKGQHLTKEELAQEIKDGLRNEDGSPVSKTAQAEASDSATTSTSVAAEGDTGGAPVSTAKAPRGGR